MDDRVIDQSEKVSLFGRAGVVAIEEKISNDSHFGCVAAVVSTRHGGRAVGSIAISVDVQEDVSFDPGVRAIEINPVILRAAEHVVDEMYYRARTIAASKVHHFIVANRS